MIIKSITMVFSNLLHSRVDITITNKLKGLHLTLTAYIYEQRGIFIEATPAATYTSLITGSVG